METRYRKKKNKFRIQPRAFFFCFEMRNKSKTTLGGRCAASSVRCDLRHVPHDPRQQHEKPASLNYEAGDVTDGGGGARCFFYCHRASI